MRATLANVVDKNLIGVQMITELSQIDACNSGKGGDRPGMIKDMKTGCDKPFCRCWWVGVHVLNLLD